MSAPPGATEVIVSTPAISGRDQQSEPVTVGLPLPRGMAHHADQLALADENGRSVPLQVVPIERWADDSLRWALLDFQVTGDVKPERRYALRIGPPAPPLEEAGLLLVEAPDQIVVATGAARFVIGTGEAFPFADVTSDRFKPLDGPRSALRVTDASGRCHAARVAKLTVEERGDLRTTVRMDGTVGPRRRPWLLLVARLQFFAGSAAVRVAVTLRNPRRARHRGGIWELGDHGSVYFRDASVHLTVSADARTIECAPEVDSPVEEFDPAMDLYQDSSGGEHWRHETHVNRHGQVPCTFRGYRLVSGARSFEGLRATPAVLLRHEHGCAGIAVEHFWQNCPKAMEVGQRALIYRLFPGQYADRHELQGGEQKTHRFTLMFGDDPSSRDAWHWGRRPCSARATPAWYCASGAVPYLSPAADDLDDRCQSLVDAAIAGPDSFERKREAIDEYGWRHFGDLYADHENAFSGEGSPIVSHYNNQYDAVAGFACQFMRSGDWRWHQLMSELAAHVVDIDIYHTDRDKSAYNHGLFWHTAHYVPAGRSTHRSYPRSPKVNGGGPSNEHNYTTGLMLHHFLTGDPTSRETAEGLARWVVAMDDGRKTIFRWLARTPTGLASQTHSADYHGPGRGAGHSLRALLDGHRLTGESALLNKAEELIRRVIHPSDDVSALDLLDAERRWSYTAFLQALGVYLDYKAECGQIDGLHAYARASLLHYARWMAVHEYPYLDKPEILEYPTETWAAQDMRKSDVFYFAACHAVGSEGDQFRERGSFFFHSAVSMLQSLQTRRLTRPVVLLLSNGRLHGYLQRHSFSTAAIAACPCDFPRSPRFVPQKTRARRRLLRV